LHLLLKNCQVISPEQNINGRFDILIVNGVIDRLGVVCPRVLGVREVMEYDLTGKVVVPGFFDMHVHFREPGQTYKEDIQSGALAAAYGGFTGVLCMPNTKPSIDNTKVLDENTRKAKNNVVSIYSAACATIGREGNTLTDIEGLCKSGALAVTDDGSPIASDNVMREVLKRTSALNIPVIQHCEIMSITDGGIVNKGAVSETMNLKGIPNASEYKIIERDVDLTREVKDSKYHIQHISTKEGVELVRKAKREGLNVTAEACPHHFLLTEEAVLEYGTNAKINPPLRTKEDVNAIIEGLSDRTIDIICTDHAPHSDEEKKLSLEEAPFGIVGLETAIGLVYTHLVQKGIISFEDLIYKMSINPRKILNLPIIKIQEGETANLTILDLNKEWEVDVNGFHSKSRNTPFAGWKLKGKSSGIINNRQHLIYE
jgi:dihydroorotase